MPGLCGTVVGDPVAQSVSRRRQGCCNESELWTRQVTSWVLIFSPTSPLSLPWQGGRGPRQRTAPFSVGCHPPRIKGIQGSGMGLLTSRGLNPRGRARTSRNCSLFSFPLFFSQLLKKICPKNHSQQPSHPSLLIVGP